MVRRTGSRWTWTAAGFTVLELIVVIGIITLLTALTIPVGKSLREGNRMMACASRLHALHAALKLYFLDERGVPPFDPLHDPHDANFDRPGCGLHRLYTTGYLGRESTLHCAAHLGVSPDNDRYFHSYDMLDPLAKRADDNPLGDVAKYKYLPYRGEDDPNDPDFRRQLAKGTGEMPLHDPAWQPDDTTVVCWCDRHADSFRRGGEGQYQVLFWGGEVLVKPRWEFRDASQPPTEAWRVSPSQ
jgi:type II secretory pathway pseudopilin PulG